MTRSDDELGPVAVAGRVHLGRLHEQGVLTEAGSGAQARLVLGT